MSGGNTSYFKDSAPDERLSTGASEALMKKANPPKGEIVFGWLAILRNADGDGFYFSPTIWADRYECFQTYGARIHSFQKINSYTGENL